MNVRLVPETVLIVSVSC